MLRRRRRAVDGVREHSTAASPTPASARSARTGIPVHSALPTASRIHGWLTGRGPNPTRPLPALYGHLLGDGVVASVSSQGCSTAPPIVRRHAPGSMRGMS